MWFLLLAAAMALLGASGIYFRRRLMFACEVLGVSQRWRRLVGIAVLWLLFGLPAIVFLSVLCSLVFGLELPRIPAGAGEWLLVYPFWMAVLIVFQSVPYFLILDCAAWGARRRWPTPIVYRHRAIASLSVVALFALYTPARIVIERNSLDVNRYRVGDEESETRLRIAFFADLQVDEHTDAERSQEVVDLLREEDADLILMGGDWINRGPDHIELAGRVAAQLYAPLGSFSVRGDHEHFAYRDREKSVASVTRALADGGLQMLHNQVKVIEQGSARVAVAFLSYNYIYRSPDEKIKQLFDDIDATGADYKILVTHQFDKHLGTLARDQFDLALIAHTHGGQVNPLVGFVHVPIARVETPYVAGRYQLGGTTLIVTSGIGFSIAPFRYASPASVEIIDVGL